MTRLSHDVSPLDWAIEESLLALFLLHKAVGSQATEPECLSFLKAHYRTICLTEATAADPALAFLAVPFVQTACRGHRSLGNASVPPNVLPPDPASSRSRAIATATRLRHGTILSPLTGRLEPVHSSIGKEWSLHRVGDELCLASQLSGTMVAVDLESIWVFPQRRLVVFVPCAVDQAAIEAEIARMFNRCLTHAARYADYLGSEAGRAIAITDFTCPHIAHNLWNLQTGWANALRLADTSQIKRMLVYEEQDFFGRVNELFPEAIHTPDMVVGVRNDDDVFLRMLDDNLLLLTVKDEFFTLDFVARVLAQARAKCSPEFLNDVVALKATAWPLVVTTIRLDNRSWIEQREGLPALFGRLRQTYPHLGLVLDGLSSDTVKGWTTMRMSLDAELEMANHVKSSLPEDMPVWFSVGRMIAESIVLVDAADMFIAPTGSGMTLYKWLSNQPGLAFSNRCALDDQSPERWILRVWHDPTFRPDIAPTVHLPYLKVEDVLQPSEHPTRANFHLDWNDLYEASIPIIRGLPEQRL